MLVSYNTSKPHRPDFSLFTFLFKALPLKGAIWTIEPASMAGIRRFMFLELLPEGSRSYRERHDRGLGADRRSEDEPRKGHEEDEEDYEREAPQDVDYPGKDVVEDRHGMDPALLLASSDVQDDSEWKPDHRREYRREHDHLDRLERAPEYYVKHCLPPVPRP